MYRYGDFTRSVLKIRQSTKIQINLYLKHKSMDIIHLLTNDYKQQFLSNEIILEHIKIFRINSRTQTWFMNLLIEN